jgi:predicted MFS family arabinose efflux permease
MTPKTDRSPNRWLTLAVFMWIIPPLLPAIRKHFHLSYTEMGAFLTLYRFVGNIFQAPAAYLVHIVPISTIFVSGLLLMSVGMFIASMSTSFGSLVWISTVSGLGRATYHPLAVTMLSRLFGRDAFGRAMGLHLSGSSVGMVAAPFIAGLLLSRFGWRLPLQVWACFGMLAGLSLYFFLRNQNGNLQPKGKKLSWPFFLLPWGFLRWRRWWWGLLPKGFRSNEPFSFWLPQAALQPCCCFRHLKNRWIHRFRVLI